MKEDKITKCVAIGEWTISIRSTEELKQGVVAKAAKVKRYEARNEQQRQNKVFEVEQGRLYQGLNGKERHGTLIPDIDEARSFWSSLWENPVEHNTQAE